MVLLHNTVNVLSLSTVKFTSCVFDAIKKYLQKKKKQV